VRPCENDGLKAPFTWLLQGLFLTPSVSNVLPIRTPCFISSVHWTSATPALDPHFSAIPPPCLSTWPHAIFYPWKSVTLIWAALFLAFWSLPSTHRFTPKTYSAYLTWLSTVLFLLPSVICFCLPSFALGKSSVGSFLTNFRGVFLFGRLFWWRQLDRFWTETHVLWKHHDWRHARGWRFPPASSNAFHAKPTFWYTKHLLANALFGPTSEQFFSHLVRSSTLKGFWSSFSTSTWVIAQVWKSYAATYQPTDRTFPSTSPNPPSATKSQAPWSPSTYPTSSISSAPSQTPSIFISPVPLSTVICSRLSVTPDSRYSTGRWVI